MAIVLGTVVALLPSALTGPVGGLEIAATLVWVSVDGWLLATALRWGARRGWSTRWTLGIGYALVVAFGALWLAAIFASGLGGPAVTEQHTLGGVLVEGASSSLLVLGVWGLVYVIPRVVRDERDRQDLLREAERARVRTALEPHFVLNTLTAIGALVGDDPETARELIGDLGDLLRDVVQLADRDRQSAADEVAWLSRYARVLEVRHRGRLAVEFHLERAAAEVQVPVLVLQPLVENAIQHGALQRATGGRVRVDLRMIEHQLCCTIEDNGPGIAGDRVRDGARGLALTRRRLTSVAPGAALSIDSAATGTRAVVTLPGAA